MTADRIAKLINGTIVYGSSEDLREVHFGVAADLMSEILTLMHDDMLLITGLSSVQAVHTAIISEIGHILLVRGKKAEKKMISLAAEHNVMVIESPLTMFAACGILYGAGLKPVY